MGASCALPLSPLIMSLVTGLNLLKCVCITYTLYLHRSSTREPVIKTLNGPTYLTTIGNDVANFLQDEDEHTIDLNWATKQNFKKG